MDSTDPIDFWRCFWGTKHRIVSEIATFCSISVKFIRWGIADLGPLLDVMQQRPDLVIEMTPQSLGEAGSAESGGAECSVSWSEWKDMKQHDAIVLQKSEGLKVINLPNIMLQVLAQSIVRRNSDSDSHGPRACHIPWKCDHASCIIIFYQLFHLLVQAMSKQIQTLLKWKTRAAIGFPTTSGMGKSWLEDIASSENLYMFTTHKIKSVNVAVVCCAVLNKLIHQQFVL